MDKWEYMINIFSPSRTFENKREAKVAGFPDWKLGEQDHSATIMVPTLDLLGELGWELMTIQPIYGVTKYGDIYYKDEESGWSNYYFCVFKRRKQE